MSAKRLRSLVANAAAQAGVVFCCISCGGGAPSQQLAGATGSEDAVVDVVPPNAAAAGPQSSSSSDTLSSETAAPVQASMMTASTAAVSLSYPDTSQPFLALPSTIVDGSTVELQCGRVYQGTLNLRSRTNVTVKTVGTCGKAVITPAQPVGGWSLYKGSIYSAPIAWDAAQVMVGAQPVEAAHWPSRSQVWAKATGTTSTSLSYSMPNADLVGATLLFRPYDWAVDARKITAYSNGVMTLASTGNLSFDGRPLSGQPNFYVEGKLWMLDEPGEWAVSGGRLYLWAADGASPANRTWASPNKDAIDASNSKGVTIDSVRIFGAANGIKALGAANLKVVNTDIVNSSENAILNSGGSGLTVDTAGIRNSRHDGIVVGWGGGGETIKSTSVDASGTLGMPTSAHAAINLVNSVGSYVAGNTVANSAYIGIRVFRSAVVSGNTVDSACLILSDCGGIYLSAPDKLPLNTRIDSNAIRNVGKNFRLAWGIQMDNHANYVTVNNNNFSGNGNGIMIFDGANNAITWNAFSASTQAHIQMSESGSTVSVRNNTVTDNKFSTSGVQHNYRVSSDIGASSVAQFATYNRNQFVSSSTVFANFNGALLSFDQWKAKTGQDGSSTYTTP
jgi:parallel beta-helix repeat protein